MMRERALRMVLVMVGLLFAATVLGILTLRGDEDLQMMLSLYATLGVFLLAASRNPSRNRSLIAFTAWSSLAHSAVMAVQCWYDAAERAHLLSGTTILGSSA